MRDATQPLGLGPPRWKSNETPGNQAETAVVDAETAQAVNTQAQEQGLPEEAIERSSPTWKLKISALASRRGGEAIQPSLGTSRETPGNQSETAVVAEAPLARTIQAQGHGRAEETKENTSSARKPKISALAPRGGEAIRSALRTSETPSKQSETAVVECRIAARPQYSSPRARPSGRGDTTPFSNRDNQDFGARLGRRGHSWCSSDPTARPEARECRGVERRQRATYASR